MAEDRGHERRSCPEEEMLLLYLEEVDKAATAEKACALAATLIAERTHFSRPAAFLYEEREDALLLKGYSNHTPSVDRIERGRGVCWRAFRTQEIQLVNDVTLDSDYFQDMTDTQAELCVPIMWHGRIFGVLDVEAEERNCFRSADVRFMRLLAGILGSVLSHVETEKQLQHNIDRGKMFRRNLLRAQEALNKALDDVVAQKHSVEEYVRIQRALIDVSKTLFSCRTAGSVYPIILDVLHKEMGFSDVILFGRRSRDGRLESFSLAGVPLAEEERRHLVEERKGIVGHVIESHMSYLCNNTAEDPYFRPDEYGTRSELVVSICHGDFLWGLIVAISERENAFSHRELEIVSIVAGFMAVVLENIANLAMLERELAHMRFLHEMVNELSRERDNARLAIRVTRLLAGAFPDYLINFFWSCADDPERIELAASNSSGGMLAGRGDAAVSPNRGLAEAAFLTRSVLNIPDVRRDPRYLEISEETRSELDVPIVHGERVLGVLCLESPRENAFSREDEEIFSVLARHLGALRAANDLLDMTERKALRDGLTDVWNRRFILDYLEREAELPEREGRIYALVMIDLERFKMINDTFGHAIGDEVLIGVARALARTVGDEGIIGRYGGDEFLAVLPGASREQAARMVELMRSAVENLRFSEPSLVARANFGIALFPEDGTTLARVLRVADERMYANKGQAHALLL